MVKKKLVKKRGKSMKKVSKKKPVGRRAAPKLVKRGRGPSNKSKITKVMKLKSIALGRKKESKKWSFNLFKPKAK